LKCHYDILGDKSTKDLLKKLRDKYESKNANKMNMDGSITRAIVEDPKFLRSQGLTNSFIGYSGSRKVAFMKSFLNESPHSDDDNKGKLDKVNQEINQLEASISKAEEEIEKRKRVSSNNDQPISNSPSSVENSEAIRSSLKNKVDSLLSHIKEGGLNDLRNHEGGNDCDYYKRFEEQVTEIKDMLGNISKDLRLEDLNSLKSDYSDIFTESA